MSIGRKSESFFFGISLPFRSALLIAAHPRLLFWSMFPIAIGLAFYIWVLAGVKTLVMGWISSQFAGWLAAILLTATWIFMVLIGVFCFTIVVTIIASPFNDFLAESAEPLAAPPLPPVPGSGLGYKVRLLMIDIFKSLLAGVMAIITLVMSWAPGLNIIAAFMTLLLVAFQFLTYPQTRRGEGIAQGIRFIFAHIFSVTGFGLITTLLFSVPFLTAFMIPIAVVGGTLLYARAKSGTIE